jgi:hypothetical protein
MRHDGGIERLIHGRGDWDSDADVSVAGVDQRPGVVPI